MNETKLLRHILQLNSNYLTTDSFIELNPTVDPEIRAFAKDGFFLSAVVLLFLYVLKLIYVSMVLFKVITATDESQKANYPGVYNLCCDIITCVSMIIVVCLGIYMTYNPDMALILGTVYLASVGGSLFKNFIGLISICNSEHHNEYTLSYGLISMAIVITESLSVNIGGFHVYFSYLQWKEDNKDKNIQFLP